MDARKFARCLLPAAVICCPLPVFPYQIDIHAGQWDRGWAVDLDPWEDVVLAGDLDDRFAVLKRASETGQPLWQRVLGGPDGRARAVIVDAAGDVLACGYRHASPSDRGRDFAVVKLSGATGTTLWEVLIDGRSDGFNPSDFGHDQARGIALGPSGEVFVAGNLDTYAMGSTFSVVKLNANGSIAWKRRVLGSQVQILGDDDEPSGYALELEVDAAGNPVAVGWLDNFPTLGGGHDYDFAVVKLHGQTGSTLWSFEPPSSPLEADLGLSLALAPGGQVSAGGYGAAAPNASALYRLDGTTGQLLWQHDWQPPAGFMMLTDLDVGPAGDVIAGGLAAGPVPVVYKLSGPTGAELWQSTPGGAQDKGGVVDLEVTPGGFVYGTGYITSSEDPSRERILAFRLDSQGQVDWLKRIGPGADDGIGLALALDHSAYQNPLQGHLYLTGDVVYPGPEQDMTLVRLRTLDGWGAGYIPPFMWRLLPISLRLEVLWLGKYEDRRELEEEIAAALAAEPAMRDFVWTRSAPDLLLHADRQVILGPLDEEEEVVAIEWIRCHQERLQAERQAAAFFPLLAGGPGEMLATRYFESEERPPGGAR